MYTLHTGTTQQIDAVGYAVKLVEHNPADTGLDNKFCTFHTRRRRDIKRGAFARIIAPRHLGYSIGLGMKHIMFGNPGFILAHILKPLSLIHISEPTRR